MRDSFSANPAFVADSTLGKLTKHLRLAGFDTLLSDGIPDPRMLIMLSGGRRIILTRSTRVKASLGGARVLFVREDQVSDQMKRVIGALGLKKEDLQPMTRCAVCNHLLKPVSKMSVGMRVADFTLRQHTLFKECPACNRVYWPGSHAQRWIAQMDTWFEARQTVA